MQATIAQFKENISRLESVADGIRQTRQMVSDNQHRDPASAAYLIELFDLRLGIISEMVAGFNRMIELIITFGRDVENPVEEMKQLLEANTEKVQRLQSLVAESMKVAPGFLNRGKIH